MCRMLTCPAAATMHSGQANASAYTTQRDRAVLRVLLVDDEPRILAILERLLNACETVAVGSGEEAIALLERGASFDVVISDHQMYAVSGIEVLASAATAIPGALRIMHSGAPPSSLAELEASGIVERFIEKPGFPSLARLCRDVAKARCAA